MVGPQKVLISRGNLEYVSARSASVYLCLLLSLLLSCVWRYREKLLVACYPDAVDKIRGCACLPLFHLELLPGETECKTHWTPLHLAFCSNNWSAISHKQNDTKERSHIFT